MADETQGTSQSSQSGGSQSSQTGGTASGGASSQTQTSTGGTTTQQTQATAPSRPEWLPESFWDDKSGIKHKEFGDHFAQLATRDAAEQVRRNALPQKAEDIKLDLPKDFKLPQGIEFKFQQDAPELSKFKDIALKRGLDQDTISDLIGVYAETQVASQSTLAAAKQAQVEKLGANGPARITALQNFFAGLIGEQDAKHIGSMLVTADIVQAAERMVAKFSSQGGARFSQAHRDAPDQPGRVNDEQWNRMSDAERLDYSRRFPQSQMPEWRDPRVAA